MGTLAVGAKLSSWYCNCIKKKVPQQFNKINSSTSETLGSIQDRVVRSLPFLHIPGTYLQINIELLKYTGMIIVGVGKERRT